METFLYVVFALICLLLIGLILIQQGKGAGVGFSMGGASQAMFGGSGGREFFIKLTAGLAVAFVVICIILARMATASTGQYNGALAGAEASAAPVAPTGPLTGAPAGMPLSDAPAVPMSAAPLKATAPLKAAAPAGAAAPAPAPAKP